MNRFRKILKISALTLLMIAVLLVTFHFWLIAHAKTILSEIVTVQSKGRYRLEMENVTYNYPKLRLELLKPILTSVDSANNSDRFQMNARLVTLQLEKLWPLIAGRELLMDSILVDRPVLNMIHQKRGSNQIQKTAFSLSFEMEKLYQSIQSVLTTLKVGNFRINKGAFTLNSVSQKNAVPFQVKDIDFDIKGFNIDSTTISQHPNSYTEEVRLNIAGQTIQFPDGDKSIRFSAFRFIANKGILEVDSCSISGGDYDSTKASFNLFATKMRIKNVFLAANDSTDYNRIDSLFFTKPKVSLSIQIKDVRQDSSESIAKAIRKITSAAFGRLLVRYVSINNVDFDIEVERKDKQSTFNFVQDSLVMANLGVGIFPSMPLSASSIRFGVKEFVDYFRDSTYLVRFDSVRINNDQFSLFNINIESTDRVKKGHQKIFIPTLQIQGIDWYELISQKRLIASDFKLNDPAISIVAANEVKSKTPKKNSSVEELLRQIFVLKNITVINGSVNYIFSGNEHVDVRKINSFLSPGLSTPGVLASVPRMIRYFNTGEVVFIKGDWKISAQDIAYQDHNSFHAASLEMVNSLRNLRVNANDVSVLNLSGENKPNSLRLGKITWHNATITMDLSNKVPAGKNSRLSIGAINGGPTALKIIKEKTTVEAKISKLNTGSVVVENGKVTVLEDLEGEGNSLDIITANSKFHSGKFSIKDQSPSSLSAVSVMFPIKGDALTLDVPEIDVEANIRSLLNNSFEVNFLKLLRPKIMIAKSDFPTVGKESTEMRFPDIDIKNIEIQDPDISFNKALLAVDPGTSNVTINRIKMLEDGQQLNATGVKVSSRNFSMRYKDSLEGSASKGALQLAARSFVLFAEAPAGKSLWQLNDGTIDLSNINLLNKRSSGTTDTLQLESFHAGNISIDNNNLKKPLEYFAGNPRAIFNNLNINYRNDKVRLVIKKMKGNTNTVSLDSLVYRPQQNRNFFLASQAYQKDYITLESGPLIFTNIDVNSWVRDSILRVGHVQINNANLNDTRDKGRPLQPGIIKGLPVTIFRNLPIKTLIDSVSIIDSRVRYHEISEKTRQTGNLRFTKLDAVIRNIKNYDFVPGDSLQITATGNLMDSAHIQLRMKESYNDSLASFPLVVKVRPFDTRILNPFLLPVMSVRIKSGMVDSIEIRALGQEFVSLGEMRFFYRNLKVEFLKASNDQKKTLLTSLITFAANSFVISTNNRKRTGKIYFERMRDRSFFNYLVKMVASGAASSVGAKRSQKYNRLYSDKIKELTLPGIDY